MQSIGPTGEAYLRSIKGEGTQGGLPNSELLPHYSTPPSSKRGVQIIYQPSPRSIAVSHVNTSSPRSLNKVISLICGVVLTFATVWAAVTDTSPRKADIERSYYTLQMEKEKTKQIEAQVSAGVLSPNRENVASKVISKDDVYEAKKGVGFVVNGSQHAEPKTMIFTAVPVSISGAYKLISSSGDVVSYGWPGEPESSTESVRAFLEKSVNNKDRLTVYSLGKTLITM